jgi:hypothetical protein
LTQRDTSSEGASDPTANLGRHAAVNSKTAVAAIIDLDSKDMKISCIRINDYTKRQGSISVFSFHTKLQSIHFMASYNHGMQIKNIAAPLLVSFAVIISNNGTAQAASATANS